MRHFTTILLPAVLALFALDTVAQVVYPVFPPCGTNYYGNNATLITALGDRVIYEPLDFRSPVLIAGPYTDSAPDTLLDRAPMRIQTQTDSLITYLDDERLMALRVGSDTPTVELTAPADLTYVAPDGEGGYLIAYESNIRFGGDDVAWLRADGTLTGPLLTTGFGGALGVTVYRDTAYAIYYGETAIEFANLGRDVGQTRLVSQLDSVGNFRRSGVTTYMQVINDRIIFISPVLVGADEQRLWGSDGTAAGTVALLTQQSAPFGPVIEPFTFDDEFYFFFRDPGAPSGTTFQAHKTDGTPAGTVSLSTGTTTYVNVGSVAITEDYVYYSSEQGYRRTNGSIATTEPFISGDPDDAGLRFAGGIYGLGEQLFIGGSERFGDFELYRLNGDSYADVEPFYVFNPDPGRGGPGGGRVSSATHLFLEATTPDGFNELYVIDATRDTPLARQLRVDSVRVTDASAAMPGSVELFATGDSVSYTIDTLGLTNPTGVFDGLDIGTYAYTVTDRYGCTRTGDFTVGGVSDVADALMPGESLFHPNVATAGQTLTFDARVRQVTFYDLHGKQVANATTLSAVAPALPKGIYVVRGYRESGAVVGVGRLIVQ